MISFSEVDAEIVTRGKANKQTAVINLFEKAFIIFVLFYATGPINNYLSTVNAPEAISQIIWLLIYGILLLLILLRLNQFIFVLQGEKVLLLLVGLAFFSILWSAVPNETFQKSVALIATTGLGIYLAARYKIEEQLLYLSIALAIALTINAVAIFVFPEFGIHQSGLEAGKWRGIYHQKGVLGLYAALAALVFLVTIFVRNRKNIVLWGYFVCSLILLYFSNSMNPTVALIFTILSMPVLMIINRHWHYQFRGAIAAFFASCGLVVLGIIYFEVGYFLEIVGRERSFTGRVPLWAALFEKVFERPFFGYGYHGFWHGWNGPSAEIWRNFQWLPNHAHNGFLEQVLALGLIGLFLLIIYFSIYFYRALIWMNAKESVYGIWPILFFLFFILFNLTSTAVLTQNHLLWIIFITIGASISARGRNLAYKHKANQGN